MQFFGARANIAKLMMMAINGARDENKFEQVGTEIPVMDGDVLDYGGSPPHGPTVRGWLRPTFSAMNTIHYMHDKYAYEKRQMALHDTEGAPPDGVHCGHELHGGFAFAIKYAKSKAHP